MPAQSGAKFIPDNDRALSGGRIGMVFILFSVVSDVRAAVMPCLDFNRRKYGSRYHVAGHACISEFAARLNEMLSDSCY